MPASDAGLFHGPPAWDIHVSVQGSPMTYALMTIAMLSLAGCLVGTVTFARARMDDTKPSGLA